MAKDMSIQFVFAAQKQPWQQTHFMKFKKNVLNKVCHSIKVCKKMALCVSAVSISCLVPALAHAQSAVSIPNITKAQPNVAFAQYYLGVTVSNNLYALQLERPSRYGIFYANTGAYIHSENSVGYQVGWKYPYGNLVDQYSSTNLVTTAQADGVYLGAKFGTFDGPAGTGNNQKRLGAGLDVSYVWLNRDYLSSVGFTVGLTERNNLDTQNQKGVMQQLEPAVILNTSITFGTGK